jgi:hypothetical protein
MNRIESNEPFVLPDTPPRSLKIQVQEYVYVLLYQVPVLFRPFMIIIKYSKRNGYLQALFFGPS